MYSGIRDYPVVTNFENFESDKTVPIVGNLEVSRVSLIGGGFNNTRKFHDCAIIGGSDDKYSEYFPGKKPKSYTTELSSKKGGLLYLREGVKIGTKDDVTISDGKDVIRLLETIKRMEQRINQLEKQMEEIRLSPDFPKGQAMMAEAGSHFSTYTGRV